ncbi:restriction endonuclease subunit S [Algoriphagus zhangzhouensis]|uniref:Type I restriction enzyme, S subunit n=1 Tax=Algoriphagus zhangzhouensis TaxID=1073327 RepID=A0A1M7ZDS1_9BACT|nr:restriction endonuclease subunit S [Algoriphagus zhangzhouensis]TDY45873.1 type I restriction enzyme S subunit [Algoriphagus zhangzhouensis]SHO63027.1 type I restriction enzyme, S subunit [Algoriphagus zhangzhouensis]
MSEKRNVPELRFPEFLDTWSEKKLGNITTKVGSGKTPRGGEQIYTSDGIPFIRSQNVLDSRLVLDGVCIPTKVHEEMAGSKVLPRDILLNITGGSIGRSCVTPEDFKEGNVNQHVCIIRLKKDSPSFLQSIMSSYRGQKLIFQGQTGSGREGLNFESIKSFKITLPSLPEQQKIAEFLTAVDKRIELLQAKKEKLEAYKKGVMQQIFSQKLRFKADDGSDFPGWEERKAKKIFESVSNKNHSGDLPILSASQKLGMVPRDENGIKIQATEKSVLSYKIVEKGNFVISLRSFQGGIDYSSYNGICSPAYTILRSIINIDEHFYKFYFKKEGFIERLSKTVVGIRDGKQITFSAFGDLKIPYPTISEQNKISQFLTSLDSSIETLEKQINQTQTWKKGLLQKMFV